MTYVNQIVGKGTTAEEALLFARVNQICCDRGIKDKSISKKTEFIEVPYKIKELETSGKKIMAIHFAYSYYTYLRNACDGNEGEFSDSEYKYYSILIKKMGGEMFRKLMKIYEGCVENTCIAIKDSNEYYKFMY